MRKLSFSSCRERVPKILCFPGPNLCFDGNLKKALIWPWEIQCFWNAIPTTQNTKFPNEETWFFELAKTRSKNVVFPKANLFWWESQKRLIGFGKHNVFGTGLRQLKIQGFPMRELGFLSCRKRVPKTVCFQCQNCVFDGNRKRKH